MNNIFRQYDIRGIVDKDITDQTMTMIAKAFASYARQKGEHTILVGRDNRLSSPRMADLTIEALKNSGCTVLDLGVVITPMLYFAARHLNINAGIMITASHNPPEYNGCKLLLGESTIYGEQIQEIRRIIEAGDFVSNKAGSVKKLDITNQYTDMIIEKVSIGENIPKIAVDCGNGTASLFAPAIFRSLGCEVTELYCDSDPSFPNHHPDPIDPKNMQELINVVKRTQSDLGIGIDGDGDRLGVVDSNGNLIWGDMLMILFWRQILPKYPGSKCIVEVKCSQSLIDEIKILGGEPIMYKTGHSLIKAKMKEIGAIFTGEMSGHMFFADEYYGFDDAIYAGARLISLLSHSTQNLTQLLQDVPKYYSTPEIRVPSTDEEKFELVDRVLKHFRDKYEVMDIDGARIIFPSGWGLVRGSNTGPELIVRCEGNTPEALDDIKNELFDYLESLGLSNDLREKTATV